jgi:hypothetical protein
VFADLKHPRDERLSPPPPPPLPLPLPLPPLDSYEEEEFPQPDDEFAFAAFEAHEEDAAGSSADDPQPEREVEDGREADDKGLIVVDLIANESFGASHSPKRGVAEVKGGGAGSVFAAIWEGLVVVASSIGMSHSPYSIVDADLLFVDGLLDHILPSLVDVVKLQEASMKGGNQGQGICETFAFRRELKCILCAVCMI